MFRRFVSFLLTLTVAAVIFTLFWGRISRFHRGGNGAFSLYRHEGRAGYGGRSRWKAESPEDCAQFDLTYSSEYFARWEAPANDSCATTLRDGYPVPDPRCTPGGINPRVTVAMLRSPGWRTGCIRNQETSERKKHQTYRWYGIEEPRKNYEATQVCELDHLVPLELGGADGLGNIWPECGPSHVALEDRYFKVKDRVEDYLAHEVKSGRMPLREAQRGIAENWTQYLDAANRYCASTGGCD